MLDSEPELPKETARTEKHVGYLFGRGISSHTAEEYGVYGAEQYIRAAGATVTCLAFPYYDVDGYLTGTKYRPAGSVKGFGWVGSSKDLWRISQFESGDLWIAEGEIDALSLAEAGVTYATSIPNGARNGVTADTAMDYLWRAKSKIDAAERVVLALDNDAPGIATAEEIARRIGKHRVWRIVWPEGIKDANDALAKLGLGGLKALIDKIEPWPVSGLYGASHFREQVYHAHKNGLEPGCSTGYPMLDELYTIAPGQMSIVTGNPSAGKSEFVDQIMVNMAEQYDWRFALCSFENEPRVHIAKLMSKRLRKSFWKDDLSEEEYEAGFSWIEDHFSFLYHADGTLSTLTSILERLQVAVMRYGIRGAVIDPYNYIAKDRTHSETDWITEMLTQVKTFAASHGVHIWFVAHPAKPPAFNGEPPIPGGYSISGSAAWFAKADCGVTIHRSEGSTETLVKVWKMRFSWHGKPGSTGLIFDTRTTTFVEAGSDPLDLSNGTCYDGIDDL